MLDDDQGAGGKARRKRGPTGEVRWPLPQRGRAPPTTPHPGDAAAARSPRDPATVLIIDPDQSSREIYGTLLRDQGHEVIEAANGAEGILLARERQPDVIITELFVAGGDGWRIPALLRADSRTASIPILAVTTQATPEAEERAFSAGCGGYLRKPCEPRIVAEEVARLLEASRG